MNTEESYNQQYSESLKEVVDFLSYLDVRSWRFPSLYTESYFNWKISQNPFGSSSCFLRFRDNKPAAHSSITAKPANPDLSWVSHCGELGDTHTHPDFQRQGHFGAVGMAAIKSLGENSEKALIFGIPNENALPGWQSRCNCEWIQDLDLNEYLLVGGTPGRAPDLKLFPLSGRAEISALADEVWQSRVKGQDLYQKDGNWIRWRYLDSPEPYIFFAIGERGQEPVGLAVLKKTRRLWRRAIDVCDILCPEQPVEALEAVIKSFRGPFTHIRTWTRSGAEAELLKEMGFRLNRPINFVLYRNGVLEPFRRNLQDLRMAMGDTDNV